MMRELHTVTIERDQLRLELDKTKRMLLTTEKKYEEALKSKASYEKLKAHCDSLQESLDLSEKIRLRQKKLLQQFQQQQPTKFDPYGAKKAPVLSATLGSRLTGQSYRARANSSSKQNQDYDVLDSLVQSSPVENGLSGIDAATYRLRSRSDQHSQKARTIGQTRSNFDSLLHTVHAPRATAGRQANGGIMASKATRESSRTRRVNEEEAPNAFKGVRSKSHGANNLATNGPTTPTKRPSRPHFLASTQASRSRREAVSKDPANLRRRPFVV